LFDHGWITLQPQETHKVPSAATLTLIRHDILFDTMAILDVDATLRTATFFTNSAEESSSVWKTFALLWAGISKWIEAGSTKFAEWIQSKGAHIEFYVTIQRII
jgi:hypothetical protein